MKKTDMQLKLDVEHELLWDPKVNAAHVGVTVEDGSVTLMGSVDTYPEKWAAEDATKRVAGVRTIAQDLKVKILATHRRSDTELASAVKNALTWDVSVPDSVTAKIENGWVSLQGTATWNDERKSAERSVRYLAGVIGVTNGISLAPQVSSSKVKEEIQSALQRHAKADANSIHVAASGGKVTLTGTASTWQAIDDAASAAWAAPGVTEVVENVKMAMSFSN